MILVWIRGTGQYHQNSSVAGYVGPEDHGLFPCVQAAWTSIASSSFAYGNFLWTGFDYRGETSHGWPDVSSKFGVIDLAGFEKDHASYYRAWWLEWDGDACVGSGPGGPNNVSLSLSPSEWSSPATVGAPITVYALTCADSVEVFVNERSVGKQTIDRFGFGSWSTKFTPGSVKAVAYNAKGDHIATTVVRTPIPRFHLHFFEFPNTLRSSGECGSTHSATPHAHALQLSFGVSRYVCFRLSLQDPQSLSECGSNQLAPAMPISCWPTGKTPPLSESNWSTLQAGEFQILTSWWTFRSSKGHPASCWRPPTGILPTTQPTTRRNGGRFMALLGASCRRQRWGSSAILCSRSLHQRRTVFRGQHIHLRSSNTSESKHRVDVFNWSKDDDKRV